MNDIIIIAIVAAVIIIAIVIAWILSSNRARAAFRSELGLKADELGRKEEEVRSLSEQVAERNADLIRKEAEVRTAEALRELYYLHLLQDLKSMLFAVHIKSYHGAEASCLTLDKLVTGMVLKAGIIDFCNDILLKKELCDLKSILLSSLHTKAQSLNSP